MLRTTWGVFTHGTKALRGYLRCGRAACGPAGGPGSRPRAAWAVVDGDSALGMVTSVFAMTTAIGKARQPGVGYVGVRNSSHFGAAGYYAALAARDGLIGLAMANDIPSVAAPGSRTAVTGSNPLALRRPGRPHQPLMLDMSIATVRAASPDVAGGLAGARAPGGSGAGGGRSRFPPATARPSWRWTARRSATTCPAGWTSSSTRCTPRPTRRHRAALVPARSSGGGEAAQERGIELPSDVLASRESAGIAAGPAIARPDGQGRRLHVSSSRLAGLWGLPNPVLS